MRVANFMYLKVVGCLAVAASAALAPAQSCEWQALEITSGLNLVSGSTNSIAGYEGQLYVAGGFGLASGNPVNTFTKWSYATQAWATDLDLAGAAVSFVGVFDLGDGPALYVGGSFSTIAGVPATGIAKWNGQTWSSLGSGLSGGSPNRINCMAMFNDGTGPALYVGGNFTTAGGTPASRVAKWNGQAWSALGTGLTGGVTAANAMAVFDDGSGSKLYVGGNFTSAGGVPGTPRIARWDGQSWSPVGGEQDGYSYGFSNGLVNALAVYNDGNGLALHVGGTFTSQFVYGQGNIAASRIARWDSQTHLWVTVGGGITGTGAPFVNSLAVFDDGGGPALYVGGTFSLANGSQGNRIAKWNGQAWSQLGQGVCCGTSPSVATMAVFDDGFHGPALYVGGNFNVDGVPGTGLIARWTCQPIAPPTGACCNGTTCLVGTEAQCQVGSGTYQSNGSTCDPDPCAVPPTETCCRGTTCISVAAGTCTGTVAGSNSVTVATCTGNTAAGCCFGDYDHNGTKDITDIFTFLNAWFSSSTYADITSNGASTPDITDIFTFLNAWFGSCE